MKGVKLEQHQKSIVIHHLLAKIGNISRIKGMTASPTIRLSKGNEYYKSKVTKTKLLGLKIIVMVAGTQLYCEKLVMLTTIIMQIMFSEKILHLPMYNSTFK